jgi:hypothetical protein
MNFILDPYLVACLSIGVACGLESQMSGRRLAIGTHVAAAVIGFYGLGATDLVGEAHNGLAFKLLFALGALFLACAWIAEMDSLRSQEGPEERGDAANHVIAFTSGLACAMQSETLLIVGCIEMFALFLKRAQADCRQAPAQTTLERARARVRAQRRGGAA